MQTIIQKVEISVFFDIGPLIGQLDYLAIFNFVTAAAANSPLRYDFAYLATSMEN